MGFAYFYGDDEKNIWQEDDTDLFGHHNRIGRVLSRATDDAKLIKCEKKYKDEEAYDGAPPTTTTV